MTRIEIDGNELTFQGEILTFVLSLGKNPDSYLFLIDGAPIPSDTVPGDDDTVKAIRVASGG